MIDYHAHLWPEKAAPEGIRADLFRRKGKSSFTEDDLLGSMEQNGIDQTVISALVFHKNMKNSEIKALNDHVRRAKNASLGKLKAFCTINPFEEGAEDFLRNCMEEQGFDGLKLHCNMQEFYPDDIRLEPIYRRMEQYGKPILFHSGGIGILPYRDEFGRPIRFDAAASEHPGLTIILGHAGRIWYEETAMLLRKHKNVYADISTNFGKNAETEVYPMIQLLNTVKGWAGTTGHLLFGSDFPFYDQGKTKKLMERAAAAIGGNDICTAEDIQNILMNNHLNL